MAEVIIKNVKKIYSGNVTAVHDFNLHIKDKEFIVFVGPSGCGKSTTLRMVAGLEDISEGTISIDGEVVNDLQPKDRHISMVFQNYALYPHLTVYENMAFPLRIDKKERIMHRLKILRKQYHLSQINLGRLLGVSKVSISNYEKGLRTPSMKTLLAMMRVFDVSADYLLGREVNVVCEDDNFSVMLASNDIKIINELRKQKELYNKISVNPKVFLETIAKINI